MLAALLFHFYIIISTRHTPNHIDIFSTSQVLQYIASLSFLRPAMPEVINRYRNDRHLLHLMLNFHTVWTPAPLGRQRSRQTPICSTHIDYLAPNTGIMYQSAAGAPTCCNCCLLYGSEYSTDSVSNVGFLLVCRGLCNCGIENPRATTAV